MYSDMSGNEPVTLSGFSYPIYLLKTFRCVDVKNGYAHRLERIRWDDEPDRLVDTDPVLDMFLKL